jgi:phytoene dehydrogenase-like protein
MVKDAFLGAEPASSWASGSCSAGLPGNDWQRALGTILRRTARWWTSTSREEKVKAPLVWMAAQSGPPPTEPLTAPFLLWQPLYHEGGIARPRGGSGMLTRGAAPLPGGARREVHLGAAVDEILVEGGRGRRRVGVGERYTARAVVSGTHASRPSGDSSRASTGRPGRAGCARGNGFGAILRLALSEPVRYAAYPGDEARVGLQLICPTRGRCMAAYADYLRGEPAADPPIVAMTFSAVDDSLAPPGGEVLWLWAQYYPLRAGGGWDEIGPRGGERSSTAFERYAPGTRDKVVGRSSSTRSGWSASWGCYRGNVMHLEMSVSQMFALRPFAGAAGYRTHLKGST